MPDYTLDEVNAEIARREAARTGGLVPANGLAPTPTAPDVRAQGSAQVDAPPENPRTGGFWSNVSGSYSTGATQGINDETAALYKLMGARATGATQKTFVDPLEHRSAIARAEYNKIRGDLGTWSPEGIAYDVANSIGQVSGALPVDLFLGKAAKGLVGLSDAAVKYAPEAADSVMSMFKAIPDFALGSGIRKVGEKESITGLPQGIAEGLAMEKTGEIGKNMSFAPRIATQVGAQGALGAGMTAAGTLADKGRLPTGEELAQGATTNAAMALPFSAIPERMGTKRDLPPSMRKQFETQISDLVAKDKLSALPDDTLGQLKDTAGKIAEYDPDNKTILNGLLEIDQEQKRRAGFEPEPSQAEAMDAASKPDQPIQGPYSREELAGLATGNLDAQDRLMDIADSYGIKEPHKMEAGALLDAIDKAESDRQAEAQRQADIAAQAEQARKDILAAQDEAGRMDAIKRFEDATRALAQAPALPAGQGFDLVPHEERRDVQGGRAMQEEQLAALNRTPALPQGQGFELVGGPKPYTQAEAESMERLAQEGNAAAANAELPTAQDIADLEAGRDKPEEQIVREYQEARQHSADAEYGKSLSSLWDFLRGRVDAKSISDHYGSAVLENLRGKAPRDLFRSRENGGVGWDKLEQEARSQGLIAPDSDLLDVLQGNVTNREQAQRDRISGVNEVWQQGNTAQVAPEGPHPEDNEFIPVNSDGSIRDGVFFDQAPRMARQQGDQNASTVRSDQGQTPGAGAADATGAGRGGSDLQPPSPEGAGGGELGQRSGDQGAQGEARQQVETPEALAQRLGIPATPEFLGAIKAYQEITGERPIARETVPQEQAPTQEVPRPATIPEVPSSENVPPTLTAPLGKDGKPLFEPIAIAPFKPGGVADVSRPSVAVKSPDMVPLSAGPNLDMGPQGQQGNADTAAVSDALTPLRVELPEMVRMTRDLIAKNPVIKSKLSAAEARGLFHANPGNPGIELRSDIFIGPQLAEVRTKAPLDQAKPALIDTLAQAHNIPTNAIQVKASPDQNGWTRLRAYQSDPEFSGQVLAHEIGHLVDFLPDQTMARGNILGRLASLKNNIKTMIEDMPADMANQTPASPAGAPRTGLIGKAEITNELKGLSQWWKPFDPAADPEYTRYRNSGPELYADAFSVLLNAPAELKARAPKFYDAFQNYLIQKPEVRETYQGIQDAMHSGQIYKDRVQALRDGFRQADEMRGAMYGEKSFWENPKESLQETGRWAKRAFVDQYAPVRQALTGEDASYAINRAIYSGSEKELYATEMHDRVSQRLQDAGLTPEDLGEYLFHLRVLNERGQMANPHGFTPKASLERLQEMRASTYTPQQLEALEGAEKEFRAIRADLVTDKMAQSGMFDPGLMQHIQEAGDYATFDVVKYIDDTFGPGIGSKIHKQIGTTEAVGNPFTATLSKDLSMLSSVNWNNAKTAVINDLLANKPDQITPAEVRFNGKSMAPVEKTTDKIGTLYMMKDGKVQGYYVDRLVAEAFNRDRPEDLQQFGRILGVMATPFRTIFTTVRPGFQAFNVIRDLRTLYRNLPGDISPAKTIQSYLKALPDAWAAEFGFTPDIVKEMQRDDMLISVADPMGLSKIDNEHDRLMKMYNLQPAEYKNTVWKPFMNLYGQTLKLGGFLERIPKIAAYRYLKENFPEWSQDQIGEFVRTKAGSPAFLYKGSLSPITNNLFLFSNAIVQGMRGDFGAMKADPKTWWSKWTVGTMAPKMIGRLALYGAFGAGIKTIMDGISDYDLSNYDVIPLGLDANGKSVYLRLPVDEMGRMTSSLLWKGLNLVDGQQPTKPADIFDFMAGQAPNVAPWATLLGGVASYLGGHNPYDAFHGREIIDPLAFKAGGWESQKQMLQWMWNTVGLGIVYRFDNHEVDTVKTDLQKAIGLPVVNDFLGRFVKVSDYGITEKLRDAGEVEVSKRAREVLDARSALAKVINGEQLTDADSLALAKDQKGIKREYGRLLTKQQDQAFQRALQSATSQREKMAISQEWNKIKGPRQ